MALERGLWVLMAEVATAPAQPRESSLLASTLVTGEMVDALERRVHELEASGAVPAEFVVPGQSRASAALTSPARLSAVPSDWPSRSDLGEGSQVVPYLNRLSDLCWLLARSSEQEHLTARGGSVRVRRAKE